MLKWLRREIGPTLSVKRRKRTGRGPCRRRLHVARLIGMMSIQRSDARGRRRSIRPTLGGSSLGRQRRRRRTKQASWTVGGSPRVEFGSERASARSNRTRSDRAEIYRCRRLAWPTSSSSSSNSLTLIRATGDRRPPSSGGSAIGQPSATIERRRGAVMTIILAD